MGDLITKLLTVDPAKRCTMPQALNHTWIVNKAPDAPRGVIEQQSAQVIGNLRAFCAQNDMKKAVLHMVARRIDERSVKNLRQIFNSFDLNGDGTLTISELQEGLRRGHDRVSHEGGGYKWRWRDRFRRIYGHDEEVRPRPRFRTRIGRV